MRFRARLLHVVASAPVAASMAATSAVMAHAQNAAQGAPTPIVIALDPGHGGSVNPNNPAQPFDPGAISQSGLEEKVVTLDVAQRVAALLREDLVAPILTRTSDTWVTISDREQLAIDSHAQLFVSIHCNSYTDATASGSLVLYPNSASQPFAQTLEDALGRDLASYGTPDDGTVLRDNWWIHNPMPTGTVEMAYMSNAHEAALMATEDFRQQVALAIRDGIERYDPQVAQRKAQILAWEQAHPGVPLPSPPVAGAPHPSSTTRAAGAPIGTILVCLFGIAAVVSCVRWRRPLARALAPLLGSAALTFEDAAGDVAKLLRGTSLHRSAARRRRRRLRLNTLTNASTQRWSLHSVYDDLPF